MTGVSTLGQALTRINLLTDQNQLLNTLTTQLATGKRTQEFSGLGTDVLTSKRSRTDINAIDAYTTNITRADSRMQLMLQSIEEFQAQADNLWGLMIGFGQESLHEDNADIVYGQQSVVGNVDLSAFASIPALVAASAPALDPPNDRFELIFSDPDDPSIAATVTIDMSDAAAAAGAGNAQVELVNYINNQIAALVPAAPTSLNAVVVPEAGGQISFRGTANITLDGTGANGMGALGIGTLGFEQQTYGLGPDNEIGINNSELDVEFSTLQDTAGDLYNFLIEILNVQDDGRFLLGGADTLVQPITDTGALDSKINTLLENWKDETLPAATNLTSTELISAYQARTVAEDVNAITDTNLGYSAALSAGNAGDVFVRVKEQSEIDYTVLANEQPFRDILVATAFIKNGDFSPIADVYDEPYTPGDVPVTDGAPGANIQEMKDNFYAMFNALTTTISQAIDDIDKIRFRVEADRARIDQIKQGYIQEKALLQKTIAGVEDVDLNEVAVEIQTLQVQLEASYTVTARVSELSLVNFI